MNEHGEVNCRGHYWSRVGHRTQEQSGNSVPTELLPLLFVLLNMLSSPASEGLAWASALGPGLQAGTALCRVHLPQTSSSASVLLPGDHLTPVGRLPWLCTGPGPLPEPGRLPWPLAWNVPSAGRLPHSDSSASGHTTGLGPSAANDHLVSPAETLCSNNKC